MTTTSITYRGRHHNKDVWVTFRKQGKQWSIEAKLDFGRIVMFDEMVHTPSQNKAEMYARMMCEQIQEKGKHG